MMIMLMLYSPLYILFILIDLLPIYGSKNKKLLWVYSIIWLFSYIILILISINVKIPSPALAIEKLITWIYGL